jgi:hypothetical protein
MGDEHVFPSGMCHNYEQAFYSMKRRNLSLFDEGRWSLDDQDGHAKG